MATPLIEVEGLAYAYRMRDRARSALHEVSFEAAGGEVVAIEGALGSGKSTLLEVIAGLRRPDEGSVRLNGEQLWMASSGRRTALRRGTLALVPAGGGLLPALSVAENVDLALRIAGFGRNERRQRASEQLEAAGVSHLASRRPPELTPGERGLAAMARALAPRPRVLVADEPEAGLAADERATLEQLLAGLAARGSLVLVATDDAAFPASTDRRLPLVDGRLHTPPPTAAPLQALPSPGKRAAP